jgi:ArsR family transcriptional regulator, arsenate/arsenite/antimonite-responsive transcriptional repressor
MLDRARLWGDPAFEALADPTRRAILMFLADRGEAAAGVIANGVRSVGRTAVSSHLRVLRVAGLVSDRRDGRFRFYSVESGAADGVVQFLAALYRRPLAELRDKMDNWDGEQQ